MTAIVGKVTKKVYVKGSKAYCFREMNKQYPTTINGIYPEPMQVVKV